ncbi:MAG: hypothetical protein IVW52_05045 [Acidimicrobiales bacterium]|nr:hypothetical protein [Acidimicrobiales bacterium]
MIGARVTFASDRGRPGVCQNVVCGHDEFHHALDGPCRDCAAERRDDRGPFLQRRCERYEPIRYFAEEAEEAARPW